MNIQEAKTHLSRLVDRAAAGEEIIIAKAGKPMAKLVPYIPPIAPRQGGFLAGSIWESPDAWEADEELAASLTDTPLFPGVKYPAMKSPAASRVAEEPKIPRK